MWAPPKGNIGLHEFLVNREGASGKGHIYPDRHPIPGQPRHKWPTHTNITVITQQHTNITVIAQQSSKNKKQEPNKEQE